MKVKFLFIVTLVAVLFTTQTSATARTTTLPGGTSVNFSTIDKTFKISLRNAKAETVTITLEDTEGVSLVNETVEATPNCVKSYRLENLPEGKYIFTVKHVGHKVIQPIMLTPVQILVTTEEREEMLLPTLVQKENKIFVNSFVRKGGKTQVRILNNEGALMFEDAYSDEILRKTFDIAKLASGVYFFEVETNATTEYFTVIK